MNKQGSGSNLASAMICHVSCSLSLLYLQCEGNKPDLTLQVCGTEYL